MRDSQSVGNISDVTLVGEDGKTFPVQKAVLAASSSFFAGILQENPAPEVVVLMRGFGSGVLEPLLDFIHVGEVRIKQELLNQFLQTMEELKLKGLTAESLLFEEKIKAEFKSESLNLMEHQNQDSEPKKTKTIFPKTEKTSASRLNLQGGSFCDCQVLMTYS